MNAEHIARKARRSISRYCYEECKSYCCRKGYLPVKKNEVDAVTQGRKEELMRKGVLKKIKDEKYSLYMGDYDAPCPSLFDYKCLIHKKKNRPDACKQFPLFIEGCLIKLSPRCPAVKEGLFYPYVSQLLRLGYKVVKADQYADMEIYNFDPEKSKKTNKPITIES